MSERPWHKRFHDDALNGYMGLSLEERGAYTTLLDLMYQRGEPLVDNERFISGWMQCSTRKYRTILAKLVDMGKIVVLEDGRLTNPRFEKERENSAKTARKASESGKIGGEKSGETRKKTNEINENAKQPLQKNEAISEARSKKLEDSSDNSENFINVVPADAGSPRYAFEGKTIKLSGKDLASWRVANPHLALESELYGLDEWAGEQKRDGKNWFHAVSGALAKKERAMMDRIHMARVAKEAGGPVRRAMPDPRL